MFTTVTFTAETTGASAITLHGSSTKALTHVEGFVGPPETRDVVKTLPGRDGALDDTRFVGPRTLVLEGEILGASQAAVLSSWDDIASAVQTTLLVPGTLTVTRTDATVRTCSVVLAGAAQPAFDGGGGAYLQYQLTLRAADPRWYGTTLRTSTISSTTQGTWTSTANLVNAGNAPSFVTIATADATTNKVRYIEVTPPTAYVASNPYGATMLLTSSKIASSDGMQWTTSSSLDSQSRVVTSLTNPPDAGSEFPILYPGTSKWRMWSESPAGGATRTLTVSWYDAWW